MLKINDSAMNRLSSDKRLVQRLSLPLAVRCTFPDNLEGKVAAKNISLTGTCLLISQNIPPGTELTLAIMMPQKNRETIVYGTVAWQRPAENGYLTGIRFTQSDPQDLEKIISAIIKK